MRTDWDNGTFDDNGNGIRGTVVYTMEVVHRNEFKELAAAAKEDPERYTVKGIDIIDNVEKKIIINIDAKDTHLETDVNNFFMAYRFHFKGQDYDKQTGCPSTSRSVLPSPATLITAMRRSIPPMFSSKTTPAKASMTTFISPV